MPLRHLLLCRETIPRLDARSDDVCLRADKTRDVRACLVAAVLALGVSATASAESRILAGNTVSIADHPYQVQVSTQLGSCGGSILAADRVVTARTAW